MIRLVVCLLAASTLFAQTGKLLGANNFIHSVADLDKSVSFYRDALGLELKNPAVPMPRYLNDALSDLTNTHGASFRAVAFKIPDAGFDLELTEFTGVDRTPAQGRNQDPGVASLVLTVRNLDAALAAAEKAGAPIVTAGGAPIMLGSGNKSIFIRDPDGMFIELSQPNPLPATTAPAGSNVIGGRFATTVKDTDATLKFYKDVFGFDVKPGAAFASNPPVSQLVDVPNARFRMSRAVLPGSTLTWEFVDYEGVDRKPFNPPIPDPGAPAFSLRVTDADALAAAVKSAGGEIVSVGPPLGKAAGSIFVRDPNGFLLELIQRP